MLKLKPKWYIDGKVTLIPYAKYRGNGHISIRFPNWGKRGKVVGMPFAKYRDEEMKNISDLIKKLIYELNKGGEN